MSQNNSSNSPLDHLISPEIKNDEFYAAIQKISREADIKTVLEIGSSSGGGSTEAFVRGLRENPNRPTLFCMEVSEARFSALSNRYAQDSFVTCYNLSSVALSEFPSREEVIEFYQNSKTNLNQYPLNQVLEWLEQDINYIKQSKANAANVNGIRKIKQDYNIDAFDLVLIDGSEFTGKSEFCEIYGAKFILLDDITTFKNYDNHQKLLNDKNYTLVAFNPNTRNGYSIFKRIKDIHPNNRSSDSWEQAEKILVQNIIKPGMVVFDVGANVGDYSVLFSELVSSQGKIYSFEPASSTFKKLQSRTEKLGLQNISLFQNIVFSNHGQLIEFNEFPEAYSVWNSVGKPAMLNPETGKEYVPIVTTELIRTVSLDSFCKEQNIEKIDYLKLDVEGAESDALQGSVDLLKRQAIRFIQFEISRKMLEGLDRKAEDTFQLLHQYGYECHRIQKDGQIGEQVAGSNAFYENFIAFPELPIHFFTIVLNGEPFIRYHLDVFKQLPFKWHWHVVEGVADLKHDTAWSLRSGGHIPEQIHCRGRSCDGTSEYLDELAQLYPDNITLYRQPEGQFWDGKKAMVSAPLSNIQQECLLWQIDADELWTTEQICKTRQLFVSHPEKTAAFYWCWYFVGPNLVINSRNCYAQNPQQDWLRTWRYRPGAVWLSHEPPRLAQLLPDGQWQDLAKVDPFRHHETEQQNLIFQHFAYVTPQQLQFKECYYGYTNAQLQWEALQRQTQFPVYLRDYFAWVRDNTTVDTAVACAITPLAKFNSAKSAWELGALQSTVEPANPTSALKQQPLIVIDGVFFQLMSTGIGRVWSVLLAEWAKSNFAPYILVLDRAGTAPKVAGIRYRTIPAYNYGNTSLDRAMLQAVCDQEQASLFISTYYTTPISTPSVFMAYDMIPEQIGWNLDHFMWREKHYAIQQASRYITISKNTAQDLARLFPQIAPESITVAPCGVQSSFVPANNSEVNNFRQKYQITQPYFLLVGTRNGYKNAILFAQAFAQLPNPLSFSIVCTGGAAQLEPELIACLPAGTRVHLLKLEDAELRVAYSGAIALVYPSKYEGFGLPILEAMACGCPVITCPNGSIPEVAGTAALYVSDTDVPGLTAAMQNIQQPALRDGLIKMGLEQAQKFSWGQMAKIVCETLMKTAVQMPKPAPYTSPLMIATVSDRQITLASGDANYSQTTATMATPAAPSMPPVAPVSAPTTVAEYQQQGKALLADYRLEEAIQTLEAAQKLSPRDPGVLYDLGAAYQAKAQDSQMRSDFYAGFAFYRQGKFAAAIERYRQFFQVDKTQVSPESMQRAYKCLSDSYQRLGQYDEAIQLLREAVQAQPIPALYYDLVSALRDHGQTQAAIATASSALQQIPNDFSLQLAQHLTLPILYNTPDEIVAYRHRFTEGLAAIAAQLDLSTPEAQANALAGMGRYAHFYLAYQGGDDRILQVQYGQIVHQIMQANYPQWLQPRPMPPLSTEGKIRIGYISDCLRLHTVGKLFSGWVQHHDRQKFEVYCYSLNREQDAIAQQLQRSSDAFHQMTGDVKSIAQQVLADQLHVLVFLDLGMHAKTTQLAGLRLAPVQCVTWGHPVTSGLPTVDYFLSSALMEPENAQLHYTEKLVNLPKLGIAYAQPELPELTKTRADFGLREDAVVYLSCQSLFKYLPQYDFVFPAIAQQVPQAQFAFIAHFSSNVTEQFRQRLRVAFAAVGLNSDDYCVIVPRLGQKSYLQLNLLADVFLDTFAWSGGNTTLEAIACNLPVVTCPGEFMRGRHAAAILEVLGVKDAIAPTPTEYIEIAVRLGQDSAWRQQMVQRIQQGHAQLYGDRTAVAALEAFYQQVVQDSR